MQYDLGEDTLERVELPFKMYGRPYVLTEAAEDAAVQYRAAALKGVELVTNEDDSSRVTRKLQAVGEVEPLLVSLCTYHGEKLVIDEGGNIHNTQPTLAEVKGWPARRVKKLFDAAKEISELEEEEDVAALQRQVAKLQARIAKAGAPKNERNGTTASSP